MTLVPDSSCTYIPNPSPHRPPALPSEGDGKKARPTTNQLCGHSLIPPRVVATNLLQQLRMSRLVHYQLCTSPALWLRGAAALTRFDPCAVLGTMTASYRTLTRPHWPPVSARLAKTFGRPVGCDTELTRTDMDRGAPLEGVRGFYGKATLR